MRGLIDQFVSPTRRVRSAPAPVPRISLYLRALLVFALLMTAHTRGAFISAQDAQSPHETCTDHWLPGTPVNGISGHASAFAVDSAGNVYVGGRFTVAGDRFVANIARWDGDRWMPLGSGINGSVNGIVVVADVVYAGGTFTNAGGVPVQNVAKWDGLTWSAVGSGINEPVNAMAALGSVVYAAGGVDSQGGPRHGTVSAWDGTNWTQVGQELDGPVWSLAAYGTDLYAGGRFAVVGGSSANQICKWEGAAWTNIGAGFNANFQTLAASSAGVVAAGSRTVGQTQTGYAARWDGSSWVSLGSGMTGAGYSSIYGLAASGSDVYAAGQFTSAGGVPANGVAKWDGSTWSAMGSWGGTPIRVAALGTDVYFSGSLWSEGGVRRSTGIAKWNGTAWSALGPGVYTTPSVLTSAGGVIYGAGYFTTNGGDTYSRAAIWNGSSWVRLGTGPDAPAGMVPEITSLAVSGTDVYIGGMWIEPATQVSRGFVFKWNGASWTELGSGMTSVNPGSQARVYALAAVSGEIYAGGAFTSAGETPAINIAKWNGSAWTSLGAGTDSTVYAITPSGSGILVGGSFLSVGTQTPASLMARWNGTAWSALGTGPMAEPRTASPHSGFRGVTSIVVSGDDVYAGGGWDVYKYEDLGFVSRWNGSTWTDIYEVCCGQVNAVAAGSTGLYAVGGLSGSLASWNGTAWSSIPLSSDGTGITALTTANGRIYVGGDFATAGCRVAAGFAVYSTTASSVTVTGRATSPGGQAVPNLRVFLTDPAGIRRTATTSSFGIYSFPQVAAGGNYSLTATSKRYRFATQNISPDGTSATITVDLAGQQ